MHQQSFIQIALITAVSAILFFTSLGKSQLWDRDEPRNAGCAAEMMARGDYITPIFNDELRHQKPVLLYWLMISAYQCFGVTEFAARFWSAALGIGTALLTYGIAKRLFDSAVALLAGIIVCSNIMFCVAARAATPDSTLIFFSTLGLYIYVLGTFRQSTAGETTLRNPGHWFPQNRVFILLMYAAFALGVLTKGPIGIVVPMAVIGMFLLIQRLDSLPECPCETGGRFWRTIVAVWRVVNPAHFFTTLWYMRPLMAVSVVLLIAAPWYVAVGFKTAGDFTNLFFLNENIARATSVMENHSGSWLYYPVTIAIGFFPWSIFLGPVLFCTDQQLTKRTKSAPQILFLVCWVLVQIGLFSIAKTKLPSYVTPCYPALAILTSFCVVRWLPDKASVGVRWNLAAVSTLVVAGTIALVGLAIASQYYFPAAWWLAGIGLIPIVGGSIAFHQIWKHSLAASRWTIATTAFAFCGSMFAIGTTTIDATRQTHEITDIIRSAADETSVATYHCLESSWVYYGRKPIFELERGPVSMLPPTSPTQLLDREKFWNKKAVISPEAFVSARPNAIFVTTGDRVEELLDRLPDDFQVAKTADFFLQPDKELVLIARQEFLADRQLTGHDTRIR